MSLVLRLLTLFTLLLTFPKAPIAAENSNSVGFFRATEDKAAYAKTPTKYERLIVRDPTGKHEYFVERQPTHIIPKFAIESVTIRKTKIYTATGEALQEGVAPNYPKGLFLNLTFKIRSPEGQKFSVFTAKNNQDYFEMRIGKRSVGIHQFDLPFEPDEAGSLEFTIYLQEDNDAKLKEMLLPFKELVIWN